MKRRTWLLSIVAGMILAALVVGNVVLFNAMPKPMLLTQPVTLDHGTGDPRFRRAMNLSFSHPITGGNRVELLEDGETIYAAMLEAIREAEHSVTLESYEFWGEHAAGAFTDALVEAAERGVSVHVLLDFIGSTAADTGKFQRMSEAGVELIRWREPSWYDLARFNHRTHRKLMVADGRTAFTGGANIADDWLPVGDRAPYRDNHFRIEGPVVAHMQSVFAKTWLNASGSLLHGDDYFPGVGDAGDLDVQVINSAPREGRQRIRHMFLYALAAAEEQVTIGTAYFYPDGDFLDALTAAAERDVDVRILVPGDSIDKGFVRHASVNRWRPMLEAGVRIHEYQPAMYHSKLMSIDDRWASIGSSNLDNRSFRINDETNLNVYDESFAREIRELIERDMLDAELYDLQRWQERPWHKRLSGWISMTVGAHF